MVAQRENVSLNLSMPRGLNLLYVTYVLNFLLMMVAPLLLGWFFARRLRQPWRLFIVGAIGFVLSQVFHIPLNAGLTLAFRQGLLPAPPASWQPLFNAFVLGLTAALCEELVRYLMLKYSLKEARSWDSALMFGAGWGGIEAIITGLLAAMAYVNLVLLRSNPARLNTLPADQLAAVQAQLSAYWAAPLYMSLLGAAERVFAMTSQLALTVLVMQVFLRGQLRWLGFAILWHLLGDAVSVYILGLWGPLVTEGFVALFALAGLGMIFGLRGKNGRVDASSLQPEPDLAQGEAQQID